MLKPSGPGALSAPSENTAARISSSESCMMRCDLSLISPLNLFCFFLFQGGEFLHVCFCLLLESVASSMTSKRVNQSRTFLFLSSPRKVEWDVQEFMLEFEPLFSLSSSWSWPSYKKGISATLSLGFILITHHLHNIRYLSKDCSIITIVAIPI